jgi:CheY-like chemotaxis protein
MIGNLLASLKRRTGTVAATARPAQNFTEKTILIVDDNPDSLHAARRALAGETYRLETAESAESTIRKLASFHPDLILLDKRVLADDGRCLVRRLLADEQLAIVPIVALTEISKGVQNQAEPGGWFDGHIAKPIDAPTLPAQIRTFLTSPSAPTKQLPELPALPTPDRREQVAKLLDAIEAGLPDSQFATATRTSLHGLAEIVGSPEHLELAGYLRQAEQLSNAATVRARSRFRSVIRLCRDLADRDPDVVPGLADLRAGYMKHRSTEMESLVLALKNGDFPALRRAGHNLKGTGAAYGFSELTDIGRAIEAAAKGNDAAAVEALLDQIDSYISLVLTSHEQ